MLKILLIVIGVMLVYSFIRFRIRLSVELKMVEFLAGRSMAAPNDVWTMLSLASAYTNAELYAQAGSVYSRIKSDPMLYNSLPQGTVESVETNIKFCNKPLPWSHGAKDHHSFRYLHYFFLKRIGGRRYNFIREEDALAFNSYMNYKN